MIHPFYQLDYSTSLRSVVTCLSSFSIADITIKPRHTMGATSSTRKPIDMLRVKLKQ